MNHRKGVLIVLSGFSGSGKGTAMKALLQKYPDKYALSISATTRVPREGEHEGVEYFFRSRKRFEEMIAKGELLEYAEYVGNYYGTPLSYVEEQLSSGRSVILEIETQGALKVKQKHPETLLLFLSPPSVEELSARLKGRGTEDDATIRKRLEQAVVESRMIDQYDYFVINDNIDECVERMHHIIETEKQKVDYNVDLIDSISEGLKRYLKGE